MSNRQLPPPDICLRSAQCECKGFVNYKAPGFDVQIEICPNCLPSNNTIQFNWTETIHFNAQTVSLPECYRLEDDLAAWDVLSVNGTGTSPEYGTRQYQLQLFDALGGGALDSVALTIIGEVILVIAEGPDPLPMGVQPCNFNAARNHTIQSN